MADLVSPSVWSRMKHWFFQPVGPTSEEMYQDLAMLTSPSKVIPPSRMSLEDAEELDRLHRLSSSLTNCAVDMISWQGLGMQLFDDLRTKQRYIAKVLAAEEIREDMLKRGQPHRVVAVLDALISVENRINEMSLMNGKTEETV